MRRGLAVWASPNTLRLRRARQRESFDQGCERGSWPREFWCGDLRGMRVPLLHLSTSNVFSCVHGQQWGELPGRGRLVALAPQLRLVSTAAPVGIWFWQSVEGGQIQNFLPRTLLAMTSRLADVVTALSGK